VREWQSKPQRAGWNLDIRGCVEAQCIPVDPVASGSMGFGGDGRGLVDRVLARAVVALKVVPLGMSKVRTPDEAWKSAMFSLSSPVWTDR
jgi:hypothetical protein